MLAKVVALVGTFTPPIHVIPHSDSPAAKVLSADDLKRPSCSLLSLLLVATPVYNSFKMVSLVG